MDYDRAKKKQKMESCSSIDSLPDDISADVFSYLDTLSAFRMSLVSRRWQHIWLLAPLSLDDSLLGQLEIKRRVHIIKYLISAHQGPVGRVCLSFMSIGPIVNHFETTFLNPKFDGLTVLMLTFQGEFELRNRKVLPASMLRFHAVRKLHLSKCIVRDGTEFSSPCLLDLHLCWVRMSQDTLQTMLSKCPGIERLALLWNSGYGSLTVPLQNLDTLFVRLVADDNDDELELSILVIENAVKLKQIYINQNARGPSVTLSECKSLQALGYFGLETPRLQLGNSVFKQSVATRLVDFFPNVKLLAIKMLMDDPKGVGHIIDFLYCFPCLEILHISFVNDTMTYCYPQDTGGGDASVYDPYGSIACLQNTLKIVALWNCTDKIHNEYDVFLDISCYFAARGVLLERLVFGSSRKLNSECIERQCSESFRLRTSPLKVCLVLQQQGDLNQMREGDPFSLLGSIYHEIIVMPQICNVEKDDYVSDNYGSDDEHDKRGDNTRPGPNQIGRPSHMNLTGSGLESSSSKSSQHTTHENTMYKSKELHTKLEDGEDKQIVLPVLEQHGSSNNELTKFQATHDFKAEENIAVSEWVVTLQDKPTNVVSSQTCDMIRVLVNAFSRALKEDEDWLNTACPTHAPHQYCKGTTFTEYSEDLLKMTKIFMTLQV